MMKMTHSSIAQLVFYERPVVVVGTETNDLVERSLEVRGCLLQQSRKSETNDLPASLRKSLLLMLSRITLNAFRMPNSLARNSESDPRFSNSVLKVNKLLHFNQLHFAFSQRIRSYQYCRGYY